MALCSICRTDTTAVFLQKDGYAYIRCPDCRFVFLDPMPSPEALSRIYNEEATVISASQYPKARSRMRRALLKSLALWRYYVGRDALDIGCGGGFMVAAMQRFGARAAGIDISQDSIAFATAQFPKATFFNESFDAFSARGKRYGFLYSSEVIEHIGEVQDYMRFVAAVAAPGAYLYMTTPDMDHPTVPEDATQWDMVSPPRHVQLFNEGALRRLFADHGFEITKRFAKNAPTLQVLARKV
jgi:cyclopropane fatty-acyl-phospholipid synthase-like methyltransferase